MKKLIALVVMIALMTSVACAEIYPLIAVVVELDTENDLILFEDDTHEIWAMEGIEDWFVDDIAILLMDDMETEDFHDDEILRAFYVGYVSET